MLAHSVFFYFFSVIAIFSSLMVITSRNTVNSVFFLILDFISVGCLFIMVGAEFLGMIILIVYVGAVAVLFLFISNKWVNSFSCNDWIYYSYTKR